MKSVQYEESATWKKRNTKRVQQKKKKMEHENSAKMNEV